ncbi:MAG: Uma2 family endonuclease [Firmicutes bacterium]|nr:Uma2 family endonuclease [Bacillota bacterium]
MDSYIVYMSTPKDRHREISVELIDELSIVHRRTPALRCYGDKELVYQRNYSTQPPTIKLCSSEEYSPAEIDELDSFIPDIMLFTSNTYKLSQISNKVSGFPNLIIEIWSTGNKRAERKLKQQLYATGKNIEHWYLTQHSNQVECWLDSTKLSNQTLKKPLITTAGYYLDLTRIQVKS